MAEVPHPLCRGAGSNLITSSERDLNRSGARRAASYKPSMWVRQKLPTEAVGTSIARSGACSKKAAHATANPR
jgi:hypothetical protein